MNLIAPDIPLSLRNIMAEIGPKWGQNVTRNVRVMVDAFTPLLARAPKESVRVVRSFSYGDDERQKLDLYIPKSASNCPIILFLHGGAFTGGDRNRSPEIYANVLYYFARQGCVGVNLEYRLAPTNVYPSGTNDVASSLAWVRENIYEYGGDTENIYLMGHSAGAAHAASYAYDRRYQPISGHGLAGLIVVSGRVRADNSKNNPNASKVEAYYGEDSEQYEDMSPVTHVSETSPPTLVAFAEYENPLIDVYCLELAYRLIQINSNLLRLFYATGHNHTSIIAHLNTSEDLLGSEIIRFIHDFKK